MNSSNCSCESQNTVIPVTLPSESRPVETLTQCLGDRGDCSLGHIPNDEREFAIVTTAPFDESGGCPNVPSRFAPSYFQNWTRIDRPRKPTQLARSQSELNQSLSIT